MTIVCCRCCYTPLHKKSSSFCIYPIIIQKSSCSIHTNIIFNKIKIMFATIQMYLPKALKQYSLYLRRHHPYKRTVTLAVPLADVDTASPPAMLTSCARVRYG